MNFYELRWIWKYWWKDWEELPSWFKEKNCLISRRTIEGWRRKKFIKWADKNLTRSFPLTRKEYENFKSNLEGPFFGSKSCSPKT